MKEEIRKILLSSGAQAVGFAKAGEIDIFVHEAYKDWIQKGWHGEMGYLERHIPLRQHTDNVLRGAKTVISLAFSYAPQEYRPSDLPTIASYAYGKDYHVVLREILKPLVKNFKQNYGGDWRICIDSAPIAERYWAIKSGIGKRGINGAVIVDECGSLCFLAEILTTLEINPDTPSDEWCDKCGRCVQTCPGKAIKGDGTINASKCINYLTIDKKGDFTQKEKEILVTGTGYIYGCDKCLRICHHNNEKKFEPKPIFPQLEEILTLTAEKLGVMDEENFKRYFSNSPFLYAGFQRLQRNVCQLKGKATENT